MKSSYYLNVLRGRTQELPDVRSRVVRVFVSSTFTGSFTRLFFRSSHICSLIDTLAERDSLIENIFPKLKDYCREQYGLEFQYADMRWGIQIESANNHGEVATCLKEIELCKKYSVATNFVVLLSHRYGSRPIPAKIHAPLFELLEQTARDEQNGIHDGDLLSQWYKIDTNCIPHAYILQNISLLIPNFISKDTNEVKQANEQWKKVSEQLRTCFRRAAELCLQRGQISESDYDEFFISITEKEIVNGILGAKDANERTLCFLRDIVDIRDHLSDSKAAKYIDMSSSSTIDEDAEKLLERLKTVRIPNALKSSNIYKYQVRWSPDGITRQRHSEYLEQFNDDFYRSMKEQIDRCAQARLKIAPDELQHEVLEHAIQCKTYVSKFHGRTDVLSKLEKYINIKNEGRPCVVHGESGCGKTSVLAKTATEVFKWWPKRSVSVVLRFLGTTPTSSTIYKTLLSISRQICEIYSISMTAYPTVNQLRDQLELNIFPQIPDNEYLLILLDSIDQLQTDAYNCKWLPLQFPFNVKCIVSTLPDHGDILENLKELLWENDRPFVVVPPFEPATVEAVYNDWLAMKHRSLSDEQRLFIKNFMNKRNEILPLFMKLVFDIISVWRSYDTIDEHLNYLRDVDDCIRYLFQHLQVIHHPLLFSRALCYMTACRSGISQNELEDVLSLDDDVLKSVFQHYIPPVRRLPGILWTRIRNDLDEYITEKEVDDAPVIYWYHRRFIEVARELYVSNLNAVDRLAVFQNMVDLFKETWKGKNKPFKIDDPKLVHKYKLDQSDGEIQANRFTTSQPIEFIDSDGHIQYNKRKLNELPQFLSKLAPDISLPIAAAEVLFNYSFMHAKFGVSPFVDIIQDIEQFENQSNFKVIETVLEILKEMKYLSTAYLICGHLLNEYRDNYAFELTGRFATVYGLKTNLTNLIQQCDEQSPRHCALIVPYSQLQPPGNGLLYSLNKHTTPVVDIDFVNGESAAITLSNKVVVINMRNGDAVIDVNLPKIDEPYLNSTTFSSAVSTDDNKKSSELISSDNSQTDDSNSEDENRFKQYMFLTNSAHNIYLVSNHGDVKFHRKSTRRFLLVDVVSFKQGICIFAEEGTNSVECWHLGQNKLFAKLDLETKSSLKQVFCFRGSRFILTVVLHDGTILFYILKGSQFENLATIDAGPHLDTVYPDKDHLICTFDANTPIDFAYIDMKVIRASSEVLTENQINTTLVKFDPPITTKPYHQIIIPKNRSHHKGMSMELFFMIITKGALYIVHICSDQEISYVCIPGECHTAAISASSPHIVFAARQGIMNIYKWRCVATKDEDVKNKADIHHGYQLFVTIDISSSAILTIAPSKDSAGLFLCSLENGAINAYHSFAAKDAAKKIPPFPRTTEVIHSLQLYGKIAVTLDKSKRELASWSYEHFTAIESRHLFPGTIIIDHYAVLSDTAVAIITNTHFVEVYGLNSLNKSALCRFNLSCPSQVFAIDDKTFVLLSNNGSLRYMQHNKHKVNQTATKQLNIKCVKLFSSVITFNSQRTLIVLADDQCSLAICTTDEILYTNINLPSSFVSKVTSDPTQNYLIFYLENKSLISCRIESSSKPSCQLIPFGNADLYDVKKNCLSRILHDENQLYIHNLNSKTSHESIQLENTCELICVNESGDYVFAMVKPHILYMYRVKDRRQLARLFVYDRVTTMVATNDFIVMGMNDRRLLTLLIADPDDPELKTKIQALPSRQLKRDSHSAARKLVEQMDAFEDMSSDDNASDLDENENDKDDSGPNIYAVKQTKAPTTSYRFVHRLNCKFTTSKMKIDQFARTRFCDNPQGEAVTDDSDVDADDNNDVIIEKASLVPETHNLDEIREKTIEHERQRIKGVQLANANTTNPTIINDYSVTSSTCALQ
ncbi:unnamed protein product [Adineta ricciae]|uniref:NACHT domain-containing protein n=1 Tax=Adineta ricciae TaxID=249248 RepID=A0A814G2U0_ADIRI|nr:unnamed protein product [Adineta ricciae]